MTETPRCCWYQSPSAFGSLARKKNPPIPVTFSISVPPAIPSRTAAPAGGGEIFGCVVVCAAIPSWFRPKRKLDPKANDRVRSNWRLTKSIPSSLREERDSVYDTCANGVLGSVKMRFWEISRLVGSDLRTWHRFWANYGYSETTCYQSPAALLPPRDSATIVSSFYGNNGALRARRFRGGLLWNLPLPKKSDSSVSASWAVPWA